MSVPDPLTVIMIAVTPKIIAKRVIPTYLNNCLFIFVELI